MKRFLQRLLTRLAFFCSLFVGVWMIVTKETKYLLVVIVLLIILDCLRERAKR